MPHGLPHNCMLMQKPWPFRIDCATNVPPSSWQDPEPKLEIEYKKHHQLRCPRFFQISPCSCSLKSDCHSTSPGIAFLQFVSLHGGLSKPWNYRLEEWPGRGTMGSVSVWACPLKQKLKAESWKMQSGKPYSTGLPVYRTLLLILIVLSECAFEMANEQEIFLSMMSEDRRTSHCKHLQTVSATTRADGWPIFI